MIRDENGMLSGYVYVDVAGRDLGSYVKRPAASFTTGGIAPARRVQPELERPV